MVGSSGLEPPTSRLSGVRSNHLSYEPISVAVVVLPYPAYLCGGDEQNRTVDPLLARQVLSQLSYTPMFPQVSLSLESFFHLFKVPCGALKIKQCSKQRSLPTDVSICLTLDYVFIDMSP